MRDKQYFSEWLAKFLSEPLRYRKWKPKPFFLRECVSYSQGDGSSSESSSGGSSSSSSSSSRSSSSSSESRSGYSALDYSSDDDDFGADEDEDDSYIPLFLREPYRVASYDLFDSVEDVLNAVTQGRTVLRRCEGIRMAYTDSSLYIDGEVWLYISFFSYTNLSIKALTFVYSINW